jgi:hypothetical protein
MFNQFTTSDDPNIIPTECTVTRIEDGFVYPFKILLRDKDKHDRTGAWIVNNDLSKFHTYRSDPKTGQNNTKVWYHILVPLVEQLNENSN